MITAAAIVALAGAAALFVLAPLRRPSVPPPEQDARAQRRQEEDAARQVLRDIELDRATGKLSAEDYADLRGRYEARMRAARDEGQRS